MSKDKTDDTQQLLDKVRASLANVTVTEKRMFGGVTLMLNNNMLCCVSKKGLMIRVGSTAEAEALKLPHARPCDGAGHKIPGFVMLDFAGVQHQRDVTKGLEMALSYVSSLPSKEDKPKASSRRPKVVSHKPA